MMVQAGRTDGEIILHTALLGTLHVPDGAARGSAEELQALASRAAVCTGRRRATTSRDALASAALAPLLPDEDGLESHTRSWTLRREHPRKAAFWSLLGDAAGR